MLERNEIMGNTRTKNTVINTLAGLITRFSLIITSFILRTVFIYTLGIQYVGVSSLFTDILSILSFTELGISSAISHALYKPIAEKDDKKIASIMNFYRTAYRIIAIVIFSLGLIVLPFLDIFVTDVPNINESIILLFLLYLFKTAVSYLLIYKSTLLVATQKKYLVSKIEVIVNIIKVFIEIVVLMVFKQFVFYLVIEIVASIVQNIIISKRADKENKNLDLYQEEKISKIEFKNLLTDIKGLAMFQMSSSIGNGIDSLVISTFISTTVVGLLSNYTLIKNQIYSMLNQFYNAIVPSIGNLAVEETTEKQHITFKNLYFLNYWITLFCSISFLILIDPFITIWIGKNYKLSMLLVIIISFDFFLDMQLKPIASFRTANGLFKQGQYRPLITTVLNVILSLFLVKDYGMVGVIGATILCRLATQWYDPWLLYKLIFKQSFMKFYKIFLKNIIIFFLAAYLTIFSTSLININNLFFDFSVRILACLVIPNLLIILFYRNTNEMKFIIRTLSNLIKGLQLTMSEAKRKTNK